MSSNATDTCSKPSWNCPACPIHPFPGTLTTYSFNVPASKAVDSGGLTAMSVCNYMKSTPTAINVSVDMVKFHLYLKPTGGRPSGRQLHRQPDQRHGSADGELHRHLHQHPDLLVVGLW